MKKSMVVLAFFLTGCESKNSDTIEKESISFDRGFGTVSQTNPFAGKGNEDVHSNISMFGQIHLTAENASYIKLAGQDKVVLTDPTGTQHLLENLQKAV